jgi:galactokinase
MTGGGFGGSIIVAAPPTLAAPLSERIVREFQAHFGRLATVTPVRASRGVSERART